MTMALAGVFLSFWGLIWSAKKLVQVTVSLGKHWGVSSLTLGVVVLALGTSLPEIFVAVMAASKGHTALAMGSVLGSNIFNLGLVLSVSILLAPLRVSKPVMCWEFPLLLLVTALVYGVGHDHVLTQMEGVWLLLALGVYIARFIKQEQTALPHPEKEAPTRPSLLGMFFKATLALLGLLLSAHFLVKYILLLGQFWQVSEYWMGVFVLALGTSLPELAASVSACRHQETELVMGNVLGSNVFNFLAVLGLVALLHPIHVSAHVWQWDFPFLWGLTLVAFGFSWAAYRRGQTLSKSLAIVLLAGLTVYLAGSL